MCTCDVCCDTVTVSGSNDKAARYIPVISFSLIIYMYYSLKAHVIPIRLGATYIFDVECKKLSETWKKTIQENNCV